MHTHRKAGLLIFISIMAVLVGLLDPGWTLEFPRRTVILWQHANFKGVNMQWDWNPTLRHKLVPDLPKWFDDEVSCIQLGAEVQVALFRHANYAGPSIICTESGNLSSYWNDEASSLVLFPKGLDRPLGVEISDTSFKSITAYTPRTKFFPLKEPVQSREANFPWVGDYMNDRAQHVKIQGITVAVTLYDDANFGGIRQISLPSSSCSSSATYKSGGYTCYRLSGCSKNLDGNVSSLKVRWFGPEAHKLKK